VLERILSETRTELERRKREAPLEALEARLAAGTDAERLEHPPRRLERALAGPEIAVIAEFKRRSPSAGSLRAQANLDAIVKAYELGGASALSVLTEGPNFEGSLEDVRAARVACGLPILRKDFLVDPYQLFEAALAGADAVLLIVAALSQRELDSLHRLATQLALDVLVEVHDREELERAAAVGGRLIGINNRDLRDFTVELSRTSRLLEHVPAGAIVVSESGIFSAEQLDGLEREGVAGVLVGETLMRAPDPQQALASLLGASRAG
jgi:indole-3-glycerol phosphate synthase